MNFNALSFHDYIAVAIFVFVVLFLFFIVFVRWLLNIYRTEEQLDKIISLLESSDDSKQS